MSFTAYFSSNSSASPDVIVFFTVILYVIKSPTFAISTSLSSLVIILDFSEVIIAVAVSLLSSPFAIAVFLITASSVASSTVTVNSTTASSPAGTVTIHFNPITSPFSLTSVKFSGVVSGTTYVVFSGILSEISISFRSCVPLFFTVIL